jgi:hypothetical protein
MQFNLHGLHKRLRKQTPPKMEILISTTVGKSNLIFIFLPQYIWIYLIFNASNSYIWVEARKLFPEYKRAISICLQYFSSLFAVWAHNDGNDFSWRTCVLTKSSVEVFYSVLNYFSVCVCVCVWTPRIFICLQAHHYSGPNIRDVVESWHLVEGVLLVRFQDESLNTFAAIVDLIDLIIHA